MADELAELRTQLKRLERRHAQAVGDADGAQRLLVGRVFVLVATAALLLAVSMTWYADVGFPSESASGWRFFSLLAKNASGGLAFSGTYSLIVAVAALAGGVSVFTVRRPWVAVTLSAMLVLLTVVQLTLNARSQAPVEARDQLAGTWCAILVMATGAVAWGNLVRPLRELDR